MIRRLNTPPSIYLLAVALLWLAVGCRDDKPGNPPDPLKGLVTAIFTSDLNAGAITQSGITSSPSKEVTIVRSEDIQMDVDIEELNWHNSTTKTDWGTTGVTTWTPNDAIGIYQRRNNGVADAGIDRNNIAYTTNSNTNSATFTTSVVPALYYPYLTTDKVDFRAYYPYSYIATPGDTATSLVKFTTPAEVQSTTLNYTLSANHSTAAMRRSNDLMYASVTNKDKSAPAAAFAFNHSLTLITFRILSTDFAGITLTKATLVGTKVCSKGTLNLLSGTLTPNTAVTYSPYALINTTLNATNYTYADFIVNPCTVTTANTTVGNANYQLEMRLELMVGNKLYKCAIPARTFLAARQYVVSITLSNTQGGNVYVKVGKGGKAEIGETVLTGEARGSFNNATAALPLTITADAGWVPFMMLDDGVPTALPGTSPYTTTIPINTIQTQLEIFFRPTTWYPMSGLKIHYDGIYAGGFEHPYTNTAATDNYYDNSYDVWKDISGNGKNGTLVSSNHNTSSGWISNALKVDGTNDKVTYSGTITSDYTMVFVLRIASGTQAQDARFNADGPNYPCFYLLGTGTTGRSVAVYSQPSAVIKTGAETGYTPVRDVIIMYTMLFNGTTKILRLYVNGVYNAQIQITNATPTVSLTTASLAGLAANNTRQLRGDYYSFMLYDRELSTTEITNIYNFNRTRFGMP